MPAANGVHCSHLPSSTCPVYTTLMIRQLQAGMAVGSLRMPTLLSPLQCNVLCRLGGMLHVNGNRGWAMCLMKRLIAPEVVRR